VRTLRVIYDVLEPFLALALLVFVVWVIVR
jgi:hypothetical protein